jgi:O-methyltransferase
MINTIKSYLKGALPKPLSETLRLFYNYQDIIASIIFIIDNKFKLTFSEKFHIVKQIYTITYNIDCPHTQKEILSFIKDILLLPLEIKGCVVEAGSYKGGSSAKFSLAAKVANRELVIFDSFEGIPEHNESHEKSIFGAPVSFNKGSYYGSLEEVTSNITKYGKIEVCRFIKGWFEETMPYFKEPIALIYIDVDLASSTRTCLKYLYPLISPGGELFSQDGLLPLVIEVFDDDSFWEKEVDCKKPIIHGLREKKLIKIIKD